MKGRLLLHLLGAEEGHSEGDGERPGFSKEELEIHWLGYGGLKWSSILALYVAGNDLVQVLQRDLKIIDIGGAVSWGVH